MPAPARFAHWHRLTVRTPRGAVWEPAAPYIFDPALADELARLLGALLAGRGPSAGAPGWALDVRAKITADGEDPTGCAVAVERGRPGAKPGWRAVAVMAAGAGPVERLHGFDLVYTRTQV